MKKLTLQQFDKEVKKDLKESLINTIDFECLTFDEITEDEFELLTNRL